MENFDRENIDELLKVCQIRRYIFHRQNFAPYGTQIKSLVKMEIGTAMRHCSICPSKIT